MVGLLTKRPGDSLMPMRHLRVAALLVLSPTECCMVALVGLRTLERMCGEWALIPSVNHVAHFLLQHVYEEGGAP